MEMLSTPSKQLLTLPVQPARHSLFPRTLPARPYVDYRICRLAGMRFGNPPVACCWLPRAVVIGLALYGRAYWHRATQARPLNPHPAPETEAVPLCTLAA